MNYRPFLCLATAFAASVAGMTPLRAQDGIEELAKAREAFEKDMAFATRPIRERYLSRLEAMKRGLGSRGDARAAAAVQDEIDRVNAISPEPAGVIRFAGVWTIQYSSGVTRRYVIAADGNVIFDDNNGKPVTPLLRKRMELRGADFLIDWGDGSLEVFKISSKNLIIDYFSPKTTYPSGQPAARGVGVSSAIR